jgi:hypothetical protein
MSFPLDGVRVLELARFQARPALRMAVRTRSRLSPTVESGKPAVLTAGLPDKRRTGVRNLVRAGVPETDRPVDQRAHHALDLRSL